MSNSYSSFFHKYERALTLFLLALVEILTLSILWFWFKDEARRFVKIPQRYGFTPIIPLLLISPYACFIWHWRDQNKRDDIGLYVY